MTPAPACHNCRRQRLKCDKSFPQCLKCCKRGTECLGYNLLFRWEPGVASRGKMMGRTFEDMSKSQDRRREKVNSEASLLCSLKDPLVQNMDQASRKYLFYFASDVCRDLVLYDDPEHNVFRQLIPLTHEYPILLQVIIANSALHMSNAYQKSTALAGTSQHVLSDSNSAAIQQLRSHKDSLVAKQQALRLLRAALDDIATADIDVTLAAVLLLIECELIDSGRNNWRYHVSGARTVTKKLCASGLSSHSALTPLQRRCLISNCLVFDILGSTFASNDGLVSAGAISTGNLSLLQDAEGNHCSSMPAILLQLIQAGAQMYQQEYTVTTLDSSTISKNQQQLLSLLHTAQSFDPIAWATSLQVRSPASDPEGRKHVASAHRAAVCIYLSRVLLSLCPTMTLPYDLESLAGEIVNHVDFIHPRDALFTAVTWPAFIAGAETSDSGRQAWAKGKFQQLWEVEPWGLMRGALEVLEQIWSERKYAALVDGDGALLDGKLRNDNWLTNVREKGVDWLII